MLERKEKASLKNAFKLWIMYGIYKANGSDGIPIELF